MIAPAAVFPTTRRTRVALMFTAGCFLTVDAHAKVRGRACLRTRLPTLLGQEPYQRRQMRGIGCLHRSEDFLRGDGLPRVGTAIPKVGWLTSAAFGYDTQPWVPPIPSRRAYSRPPRPEAPRALALRNVRTSRWRNRGGGRRYVGWLSRARPYSSAGLLQLRPP